MKLENVPAAVSTALNSCSKAPQKLLALLQVLADGFSAGCPMPPGGVAALYDVVSRGADSNGGATGSGGTAGKGRVGGGAAIAQQRGTDAAEDGCALAIQLADVVDAAPAPMLSWLSSTLFAHRPSLAAPFTRVLTNGRDEAGLVRLLLAKHKKVWAALRTLAQDGHTQDLSWALFCALHSLSSSPPSSSSAAHGGTGMGMGMGGSGQEAAAWSAIEPTINLLDSCQLLAACVVVVAHNVALAAAGAGIGGSAPRSGGGKGGAPRAALQTILASVVGDKGLGIASAGLEPVHLHIASVIHLLASLHRPTPTTNTPGPAAAGTAGAGGAGGTSRSAAASGIQGVVGDTLGLLLVEDVAGPACSSSAVTGGGGGSWVCAPHAQHNIAVLVALHAKCMADVALDGGALVDLWAQYLLSAPSPSPSPALYALPVPVEVLCAVGPVTGTGTGGDAGSGREDSGSLARQASGEVWRAWLELVEAQRAPSSTHIGGGGVVRGPPSTPPRGLGARGGGGGAGGHTAYGNAHASPARSQVSDHSSVGEASSAGSTTGSGLGLGPGVGVGTGVAATAGAGRRPTGEGGAASIGGRSAHTVSSSTVFLHTATAPGGSGAAGVLGAGQVVVAGGLHTPVRAPRRLLASNLSSGGSSVHSAGAAPVAGRAMGMGMGLGWSSPTGTPRRAAVLATPSRPPHGAHTMGRSVGGGTGSTPSSPAPSTPGTRRSLLPMLWLRRCVEPLEDTLPLPLAILCTGLQMEEEASAAQPHRQPSPASAAVPAAVPPAAGSSADARDDAAAVIAAFAAPLPGSEHGEEGEAGTSPARKKVKQAAQEEEEHREGGGVPPLSSTAHTPPGPGPGLMEALTAQVDAVLADMWQQPTVASEQGGGAGGLDLVAPPLPPSLTPGRKRARPTTSGTAAAAAAGTAAAHSDASYRGHITSVVRKLMYRLLGRVLLLELVKSGLSLAALAHACAACLGQGGGIAALSREVHWGPLQPMLQTVRPLLSSVPFIGSLTVLCAEVVLTAHGARAWACPSLLHATRTCPYRLWRTCITVLHTLAATDAPRGGVEDGSLPVAGGLGGRESYFASALSSELLTYGLPGPGLGQGQAEDAQFLDMATMKLAATFAPLDVPSGLVSHLYLLEEQLLEDWCWSFTSSPTGTTGAGQASARAAMAAALEGSSKCSLHARVFHRHFVRLCAARLESLCDTPPLSVGETPVETLAWSLTTRLLHTPAFATLLQPGFHADALALCSLYAAGKALSSSSPSSPSSPPIPWSTLLQVYGRGGTGGAGAGAGGMTRPAAVTHRVVHSMPVPAGAALAADKENSSTSVGAGSGGGGSIVVCDILQWYNGVYLPLVQPMVEQALLEQQQAQGGQGRGGQQQQEEGVAVLTGRDGEGEGEGPGPTQAHSLLAATATARSVPAHPGGGGGVYASPMRGGAGRPPLPPGSVVLGGGGGGGWYRLSPLRATAATPMRPHLPHAPSATAAHPAHLLTLGVAIALDPTASLIHAGLAAPGTRLPPSTPLRVRMQLGPVGAGLGIGASSVASAPEEGGGGGSGGLAMAVSVAPALPGPHDLVAATLLEAIDRDSSGTGSTGEGVGVGVGVGLPMAETQGMLAAGRATGVLGPDAAGVDALTSSSTFSTGGLGTGGGGVGARAVYTFAHRDPHLVAAELLHNVGPQAVAQHWLGPAPGPSAAAAGGIGSVSLQLQPSPSPSHGLGGAGGSASSVLDTPNAHRSRAAMGAGLDGGGPPSSAPPTPSHGLPGPGPGPGLGGTLAGLPTGGPGGTPGATTVSVGPSAVDTGSVSYRMLTQAQQFLGRRMWSAGVPWMLRTSVLQEDPATATMGHATPAASTNDMALRLIKTSMLRAARVHDALSLAASGQGGGVGVGGYASHPIFRNAAASLAAGAAGSSYGLAASSGLGGGVGSGSMAGSAGGLAMDEDVRMLVSVPSSALTTPSRAAPTSTTGSVGGGGGMGTTPLHHHHGGSPARGADAASLGVLGGPSSSSSGPPVGMGVGVGVGVGVAPASAGTRPAQQELAPLPFALAPGGAAIAGSGSKTSSPA